MEGIGFIGLGIMGEAMCQRLLATTTSPLWIYDRDPGRLERFAGTRAQPLSSAAAAASQARFLVIMVPGSEQVRDVINELLPTLKSDTFVIDMSTISPAVSRELAAQVQETGAHMIDAPVVKSQPAALAGELGIYVGGAAEDFEQCRWLLSHLGSDIIHMGPNGSGLVMKLCHNMLVAQIQNGVNEMLHLAEKAGLHLDQAIKAVSYGGGQCFYLDAKGPAILQRDFSPKFPLEHMHKDLGLARDLAREAGMNLPGLERCHAVAAQALSEGRGRQDFAVTYEVVGALVGGGSDGDGEDSES